MSGAHLLLPEAKAFYAGLHGLAHVSSLSPTELRSFWNGNTPSPRPSPGVKQVVEACTKEPVSGTDIQMKIHHPVGAGPFPIALFIHGGGFVGGGFVMQAQTAIDYCSILGIIIVMVEYRLAPEAPFPAAVNDCWAVLRWTADHAAELNGDPQQIILIGESAGGNLAAGMCLLAKQHGRADLIKAQISVSAVYDLADLTRQSYVQFKDDEFEDAKAAMWFKQQYIGSTGADPRNPLISPMYAEDLSGLPPAFILTAEVDLLRDEAEEFAEKLRAAGVRVKCKRYLGHFHNSMVLTNIFGAKAEDCIREIKGFVDDVLKR